MVPVSFLVMAGSLGAVSATGDTKPEASWEENDEQMPTWLRSRSTVRALLVSVRLIIVSLFSWSRHRVRADVCTTF